jgi:hypothetical protein
MQLIGILCGQGRGSSPFSSTIFVDNALIAGVTDGNAPVLATRTTARGS